MSAENKVKRRVCTIIAGGDVEESIVSPGDNEFVICADGGYHHALKQGIKPDAIVGDFDSCTEPLPEGVEIERYPSEKDKTDTWLAVEYGMRKGYNTFIIYGAFGGDRMDHSLANIQLLHRMASVGVHGIIVYRGQQIFAHNFSIQKHREFFPSGRFSLFSLTDICEGVTIKGAKYSLEGVDLSNNEPIGISNEGMGSQVVVAAKSGIMLIVT